MRAFAWLACILDGDEGLPGSRAAALRAPRWRRGALVAMVGARRALGALLALRLRAGVGGGHGRVSYQWNTVTDREMHDCTKEYAQIILASSNLAFVNEDAFRKGGGQGSRWSRL